MNHAAVVGMGGRRWSSVLSVGGILRWYVRRCIGNGGTRPSAFRLAMFHRVVVGLMLMKTRSWIGRVVNGSRNLGLGGPRLHTQSISVPAYCDIVCWELGDGVVVVGTCGGVRSVLVSILARLSRWYVIGRTTVVRRVLHACYTRRTTDGCTTRASGIMVYVNEVGGLLIYPTDSIRNTEQSKQKNTCQKPMGLTCVRQYATHMAVCWCST